MNWTGCDVKLFMHVSAVVVVVVDVYAFNGNRLCYAAVSTLL